MGRSVCRFVGLSVCLSVCLSVEKIKNFKFQLTVQMKVVKSINIKVFRLLANAEKLPKERNIPPWKWLDGQSRTHILVTTHTQI